jgi:hypothetical protein
LDRASFHSLPRKLEAKKLRLVVRELVELLEPLDEQDALDDLEEFLKRIKAIGGTGDKEQEQEIALDLTEWLSSFISFVISYPFLIMLDSIARFI